jgi:hypothetical protein
MANKSVENVEELKHMGMKVRNQKFIRGEINRRIHSVNVCCSSVYGRLSENTPQH